MIRFKQVWRRARRRLGLTVYGRPGRLLAVVRGWPPPSEEISQPCTPSFGRSPGLSASDKDYWERRGVNVYWEGE